MIESKQNQRVKYWKKLHKKKYRDLEKKFLVEGWHLVEEAMNSHWTIETMIIEQGIEFPHKLDQVEYVYVTQEVFKEITQTETPQGIMAVIKYNDWEQNKQYDKLLLVDGVQDPGNVGTIIRSALAFGIDAVVLGKGCTDLFHDKVVRATQGALFHLAIFRDDLNEWMNYCEEHRIPVFATALDETATPLQQIKEHDRYAIVVGNEGSGVSKDILEKADYKVYIPISEQSESLNVGVATSIVLYHFTHLT